MNEVDCYEDLANAIVLKAVQDYKHAYKNYLDNPKDARAKARVSELRVFFHSGWYRALIKLDGDYLIETIEKEVKEGRSRQMKQRYVRKEN